MEIRRTTQSKSGVISFALAMAVCCVGSHARAADGPNRSAREAGDAEAGLGSVQGLILGITYGVGQAPLAGAAVFLFELGTKQILDQTTTDATGGYFLGQAPSGEVGVYVQAIGFQDQAAVTLVQTGIASQQHFVLAPADPCESCPFQDVTASVGLGGYVAAAGDGHGPGAVFADLNNDGYPDLYLMRAAGHGGTDPSANQLYVNVAGPGGAREFTLLPDTAGAGNPGNATGAIAADYDNDGDLDLYVLNFDQPNALLENQWAQTGSLTFLDVTANTDPTPGVADAQFGVGTAEFEGVVLDNSLTAAWADVNRDGFVDLYVGNHNGWFSVPIEGPFGVPGRRDVFYLNNGDGTFTDATMPYGVPGYITAGGQFQTSNQRFSSTNAVEFADFDNDGWPDLLVTNKIGGPDDRDMLYLNRGADAGGTWLGFALATYSLTPTFGHMSGAAMGVDVADFDNDGDMDIYITDWSPPFQPLTPGVNDLWINRLSESGLLSFEHFGGLAAKFSWGTQWQDFDNNGFLDLHVATADSFRDFLYMNLGAAGEESAIEFGVAQVRNGRGDPAADFDRDGWEDLFVVNIDGGASVLYRNEFASFQKTPHHFLTVKLVGDPLGDGPLRSTRDAIGARVRVAADLDGDGSVSPDETQLREVVSGHGNAGSTSSLALEFGLGQATTAVVEIDWPSGRQTMRQVSADQFLEITEGAGGAIPAVSAWGQVIMVLLLLSLATIVVGRTWVTAHPGKA